MPQRFELVVLDLDGTLVDSQAILVGLVNDVLQAHGHARADAGAIGVTIGLPLDEVFRRVLPDVGDERIQLLCLRYRDRAEFVRQFRLYPEVASTLAALRAAGMRLVVGTSKGRATTTDIVRHCAID